ncbi:MAG TPA: DUF1015 domain-containing protein [Actinomycetota bacterium]|nr:DUF1015 domain-containing protein [Actinomycetota bacterium]
MPRILPFVGLLFDPARAGPLDRVTAPPYDTITPADRDRLLEASPHNVVRLDLPDPSASAPGGGDPYDAAAELLDRWRRRGVVVPDPRGPALYGYEMGFTHRGRPGRVRGVIGLVELEPWGGRVLPHERTLAGAVEDRLRLLRATRANLSCVYGLVPGPRPELARALDRVAGSPPLVEVADEEGVIHRLWRVDDGELPRALAEDPLLIADGHHRYATALRYREEMRRAHGPGPWDQVMALVVDGASEDPPVLPYHRVLVEGSPPGGGDRVRDLEEVLAELSDDDLVYGLTVREGGELVHRVGRLEGRPPTVCALHERILDAVPQGALRYTQDAVVAEQAVRERRAVAAYFLPPTTAERIRAVVERGERLPEKSTFFWPKPRTGVVLRVLDAP